MINTCFDSEFSSKYSQKTTSYSHVSSSDRMSFGGLKYDLSCSSLVNGILCAISYHIQYHINSLVLGRCGCNFKSVISEHMLRIIVHEHFLWNFSHVNATEHLWWYISIGWGNGLVPSGNLSECWPRSNSQYDITRPTSVKLDSVVINGKLIYISSNL